MTDLKFIHDGANTLLELDNLNSLAKVRAHIWGLDLSNTLHGAGGVGGLLYMHDYTNSTTFMPAYDGNGNILNYVNASTGAIAQKYEYDAFGQTIVSTGSAVGSTPFRFATKYADTETGAVNYNTRIYLPSLARFASRDTIGEQGGLNLYAYVLNDPANHYDILGQHIDDNYFYKHEYTGPKATSGPLLLDFKWQTNLSGASITLMGLQAGYVYEHIGSRPAMLSERSRLGGQTIYSTGTVFTRNATLSVGYGPVTFEVAKFREDFYRGFSPQNGGQPVWDTNWSNVELFTGISIGKSRGQVGSVESSLKLSRTSSDGFLLFTPISVITPWGGFEGSFFGSINSKNDKNSGTKNGASTGDEEPIILPPHHTTAPRIDGARNTPTLPTIGEEIQMLESLLGRRSTLNEIWNREYAGGMPGSMRDRLWKITRHKTPEEVVEEEIQKIMEGQAR